MKSPQLPNAETATPAQKNHFRDALLVTGGLALVASLLVDVIYFLVFPGDGLPGKLGWLLLIVPNLFFALGIATLTLLIWRNCGGWPLQPYKGIRNLINGLILGLLFTFVVAGAVFTLFVACGGGQVVEVFAAIREFLYAQPEESFYIGAKVIGASVAMELGGKVEEQPPR